MLTIRYSNVLIYTDGACSGNPGPGGFGAIVSDFQKVIELGQAFPSTTNNRMELTAVIRALQSLQTFSVHFPQSPATTSEKIIIYTDSVYVIRGATQWLFGWKKKGWVNAEGQPVTNRDLWEELDSILYHVKRELKSQIEWRFIRGHKGIAGNERCDEIGVAFSKGAHVSLFSGPAENYHFDIQALPPQEELPEMKSKSSGGEAKKVWYWALVNGKAERFETWKECEAVVKGRSGVKFKKVSSDQEENELLKNWGVRSF